MAIKVSLVKAVEIAEGAKASGRFFRVEFIKRTTGELRPMTCRGGVTAYVTGAGLKYDPKSRNLLGVFEVANAEGDREKDAYRMINLNGLRALVVDGERYEVEG